MSLLLLAMTIVFLALAWAVFNLIRNEYVFRVRNDFIDDAFLYDSDAYNKLPSYEDMLYKPRYWHLWTKQQWIKEVL